VERLNGRKDVIKRPRLVTTNPQFTESAIAQSVCEGCSTLEEDLLPMRHKKESCPRQPRFQTREVHRRHDSLSCSSRPYQKIAMVSKLGRQFDFFKQSLLEWLEPYLDRADCDLEAFLARLSSGKEQVPIVALKVGLLPVALEDGADFLNDGSVPS